MSGRGYNPYVGFDYGNPPPGANNHLEFIPHNPYQTVILTSRMNTIPTTPQLIHSNNNINESISDSDTEYVYSPNHCTIHIFQSTTKPVLSPNGPAPQFKKHKASTCMTMGEFMTALGCNNQDKKKNILYEFIEQGGGRWSCGMVFRGDNTDRMAKRLDYFGWNESRDGKKNPYIWIWATSTGD